MPRRVPLPSLIAAGPFRTRDATAAGVGPGRLRGGDLHRPYPGIRMSGNPPEGLLSRTRTYQPRLAPGQYFSHLSAAALYRMPLPPQLAATAPVHVSTLSPQQAPRLAGVIGHELVAGSVLTGSSSGTPIVDPVSAWCQLAAILSLYDLVAVADYIVSGDVYDGTARRPLASIDDLRLGVRNYAGRRGSRKLREAIDRVRTGVDSRPETWLRLILVDSGLPEPLVNNRTYDTSGRYLGKPDLKYTLARTVMEYEGDDHRTDRSVFHRDILRREDFEDAGWRVVRITSDDVFSHPRRTTARIRRIVMARAQPTI